MTFVVVAVVFLLTSSGVYLLMARRVFPTILGLALIGHAVNLVVLSAGRIRQVAPLLRKGESSTDAVTSMADPMPQALVLTAIVISMAITLYLIAVMGLAARREGVIDVEPMPEGDDEDAAADGATSNDERGST